MMTAVHVIRRSTGEAGASSRWQIGQFQKGPDNLAGSRRVAGGPSDRHIDRSMTDKIGSKVPAIVNANIGYASVRPMRAAMVPGWLVHLSARRQGQHRSRAPT
jgi:hypothetical protein